MECDDEDVYVNILIRLGGGLIPKKFKNKVLRVYDGGWSFWKRKAIISEINVQYLRHAVVEGFMKYNVGLPSKWNIWYKEKGRTWNTGQREITNGLEVQGFLESNTKKGYLELYCTSQEMLRIIKPVENDPIDETINNPPVVDTQATQTKTQNISSPTRRPVPTRSIPRLNEKFTDDVVVTPLKTRRPVPTRSSPRLNEKFTDDVVTTPLKPRRVKTVATKPSVKSKGKVVNQGKGKVKAKKELFREEDSGYCSSSTDFSDIDVEWQPGEEEADDGDEWIAQSMEEILREVRATLEDARRDGTRDQVGGQLEEDLGCKELYIQEEVEEDSQELDSLRGSDDDEDNSPWFNPVSDFTKPVKLVQYLKFGSADVLRKALRTHAIENRYEFYFLHNDRNRITIFCKNRCGCVWDSSRSKMPRCTCPQGYLKCRFKIHARRNWSQDSWQIRTLRMEHLCQRSKINSMVSAEYLADRYVEDWRTMPHMTVREFQEKINKDTGLEVSYFRAWLARARVKLMIYGSAAEQYARIWDYCRAIIKYNPRSGVAVTVDGVEQPEPPLFMRLFVCLAPLRDGFLKGCRPLIGVDGCHLKGAYPGQILVAVAKDGNNNIFQLAWATVEIENKDTWVFFLEELMKMLGGDKGHGFTFMSDRQKGLLEAFALVVPKAETRYCVRHIWANFKLNFSGSTFKDLFWMAARVTTKLDFEVAMESIMTLSEEAYDYLANIPPRHWSRHAFSPNCKSNMLLNNVCETFNAVIRDARDKPILTQMEWIRRYIMKRHNEKWENANKLGRKLVPYVYKLFEDLEYKSSCCKVAGSRGDTYEVQLKEDQVVVDLTAKTCSCYLWELTGIPCVHAFACMLDKRVDLEIYVHPYYSTQFYLAAYETSLNPMPGPKYWEKMNMRQPQPPAFRIQPGRPKLKKRKLEKGEREVDRQRKKPKRKNQCKKCGGFGHYSKTCDLPPSTTPAPLQKSAGRPPKQSAWLSSQRKKKQDLVARKVAIGAGPNSIANKITSFQQAQEAYLKQQAQGASSSQPSTSTATPTRRYTRSTAAESASHPPLN